jgi:hypothetical protein
MNPQCVACQQIIARAVKPTDLTRSVPRRVRKSAFIPRANGQDNDGLSVSMVGNSTLAKLRRFRPDREGVTLHVGHVREMSANGCRLDVAADPIDDDPDHALIVGFPQRHPQESPAEKAIWERLADLLAQHARCCLTA